MLKKYFDALASMYFKTAQDGRHLFCPWGYWGTCYILPSDQEYERRRRQLRNYTIVTMALAAIMIGAFQSFIPFVIFIAVLIVFYLVWVRFLVRGLQASTERLTLQEATTTQAVTHSAAMLWLLEISSLALVAAGVAMFIFEPDEKLMVLAATAFFALCAAFVAYMLVLRSRSPAQ
jgi:hypothetical protein